MRRLGPSANIQKHDLLAKEQRPARFDLESHLG